MRFATLTFLFCAGLAVALGYLLATPYDPQSLMVVGAVLAVLSIPIVLRWHYWLLLFGWNASVLVFFLPGQPHMWMLLSCVSLALSVLSWVLRENLGEAGRRAVRLQHVPSLTWTLLLLVAVVVVTAYARGGIGIRSLGGQTYGGKHYIYIFAAAVGYFAISCQRISAEHVPRALRLFYFGALTHPISNLIYIAGPAFYWLFRMFPVEFAVQQAITESAMSRFNAVTFAMMGVYSWMMARFGIAGIFDWRRPWRLAFWLGVVVVSLLGGFRSVVIYLALVFVFQFVLEGLLRTRLFPLLVMGTALVFAALVPVAPKLPFALQRALSFLPIEVSPLAKADAIASTDWRLRMWKVVWPDVPKYLWLGKGYVINPTDLYLVVESQKRGLAADIDEAVIAGDYHSGPFSVLIPFGIPGTVAFTLFCLAALRVLWRNYRHGDAALRTLNTFLLACFAAKFVFFWALFGALASDLAQFAGMAAFSVALNGGVRTARIPAATPQHAPKEGTLEPAPTTG